LIEFVISSMVMNPSGMPVTVGILSSIPRYAKADALLMTMTAGELASQLP
jgi:hypothetical protein